MMSGTSVVAAIPKISDHFQGVPNAELLVRLFLTTPFLLTAIAAPLAGYVIDKFGRKLILIAAIIVFGIAGTSGLYLNSLVALIIGRAFLGISIGCIFTACIALIADYYEREARQKMMGTMTSFMGFGAFVSLGFGGVLGDIHWRAPFFSYGIAFIILPACIFFLNEPKKIKKKETVEVMIEESPIPYATLALIYTFNFIHISVFYFVPILVPFFLQDLSFTSSTHIGFILAGMNLVSACISLTYGKIKTHFSFIEIVIISFLFLGLGFMTLYISTSIKVIIFGLFITSLGLGWFWPNSNLWLNTVTPFQYRGRAIGGLATCGYLGMFFSPIMAQPFTTRYGIASTFGFIGVFAFGMGLILFLFKLKKR